MALKRSRAAPPAVTMTTMMTAIRKTIRDQRLERRPSRDAVKRRRRSQLMREESEQIHMEVLTHAHTPTHTHALSSGAGSIMSF